MTVTTGSRLGGAGCSICNLDAKPRKIGETLLRAGIGPRDVADFTAWWATKHEGVGATSKSAWSRHKVEGHFEMKTVVRTDPDDPVLDLDDLVDQLFVEWQRANKGKPIDAKDLREWLALRAKIRADIERRDQGREMSEMLLGAAPKEK